MGDLVVLRSLTVTHLLAETHPMDFAIKIPRETNALLPVAIPLAPMGTLAWTLILRTVSDKGGMVVETLVFTLEVLYVMVF